MLKKILLMGCVLSTFTTVAQADSNFTAEQDNHINTDIQIYLETHPEIIRDVLVKHPEYLLDAQKAYTLQQKKNVMKKYMESILVSNKDGGDISLINSGYLGDKNGKQVLVEFFDYQCHFCRQEEGEVKKLLDKTPDLVVITREIPVISQDSFYANLVAIASGLIDHDTYVKVHNGLMTAPLPLTKEVVDGVILSNGVSQDKIAELIKSGQPQKIMDSNKELFMKLGANGTPAFISPQKGLLPGFSEFPVLGGYLKMPKPTESEIAQIKQNLEGGK